MNVYTQLNKPSLDDNEQWFPCLTTVPILDHIEAKVQPLLVTHIDAVKHYQHNPGPLLDQIVHCIGPRTYDRLVDLGFTNVHMYGLKAEDIKMNSSKINEALGYMAIDIKRTLVHLMASLHYKRSLPQ